ncbi:nucleotide-diphospho-sugar transferase [Xylariaceae sp. FL0804]|nr:nucleotide-diphospho-sugar transferase [Xylariaceae sp. FL0804]
MSPAQRPAESSSSVPAATTGGRFAYVTLITRSSYLAGVVVLAHTLRRRGSRHPLIVLYTPGSLAAHAVRALELEASRTRSGSGSGSGLPLLLLRPCEPLAPPPGSAVPLIAERFEDTWTKLRAFDVDALSGRGCGGKGEDGEEGGAYDALCYLDADVAVFQNPDRLFEEALRTLPAGWIGASHACVCNRDRDPWAPAAWRPENCAHTASAAAGAAAGHGPAQPPVRPATTTTGPGEESPLGTHELLNGGMFLFRPSRAQWAAMMSFFCARGPLLRTFRFPDQDFLAHFFRGRWRALGWRLNALKTMRYWHADLWRRDDDVVCLHYVVDKPWTRRVVGSIADGGYRAGYRGRDGATHRWWWAAYEDWEEEQQRRRGGRTRRGRGRQQGDCEASDADGDGHEVLELVKRGVAPPLEEGDSSAAGWAPHGLDPGLAAIGSAVQAFANNRVQQVGPETPAATQATEVAV